MKTLKEFLEGAALDHLEVIELDEDSSTTTAGVEMPDAKPIFKKTVAFGHQCIEVDEETYHKCIRWKKPFARWANYVEDESLRNEMKSMFAKNQKVLMMNSKSGAMAYVKA